MLGNKDTSYSRNTGMGLILFEWSPFHRILMSFQTAMLGTLVASLYGSAQLGTAAFTAWMYLIYATFPGIFTVLPARSAECFGVDLGGVVVGVIALSDILVSFAVQGGKSM